MKIRPLYLFIIVILMIMVAFVRTSPKFRSSAQKKAYLMGTPVRIKVKGPNASKLANLAIEEIKRLDKLFSKFNPESEIYKLNSSTEKEKIDLSPDTSRILKQATELSILSEGAFKITLGKANGKIDLGAIAKGYAVESARKLLLKSGAKSGIIDMRSSIAVFGTRDWGIGIQHPRNKKKLLGKVKLKDGQSLATSGDYERGAHIVDSRTGKPAKLCQSVTIIGTDAAATDALSTAVFVLGPDKGMKLAKELNLKAIIIDKDGIVYDNFGLKLR